MTLEVYPNPFNSTLRVISPDKAKVSVYNSNGKKVAQLPGGKITWIPEKKLSSGLYLVKAELGNQVVTTQVIFMK